MSGRIEIVGNGVFHFGPSSDVTVSRTMPGCLHGKLEKFSWDSFCNKLDDELKAVTSAKKMYTVMLAGSLLMIPAVVACFFLLHLPIYVVMALFLVVGALSLGERFFCFARDQKVLKGVTAVCEEQSALNPGISFDIKKHSSLYGCIRNVRERTTTLDYIEVKTGGYVAPSAPPSSPAGSSSKVGESSNTFDEAEKTREQRMEELDETKQLKGLSEEEYERRRAEIMSSV